LPAAPTLDLTSADLPRRNEGFGEMDLAGTIGDGETAFEFRTSERIAGRSRRLRLPRLGSSGPGSEYDALHGPLADGLTGYPIQRTSIKRCLASRLGRCPNRLRM
jgi:hypothetical protein